MNLQIKNSNLGLTLIYPVLKENIIINKAE